MPFLRRGGRKWIVAPNGNEIVASTKRQPDGTPVKAWRAHRWQRMLETDEYQTLADLADAEWINRSEW